MLEIAWLIVAGIGAVGLMFYFAIVLGKMIGDRDDDGN